ncbi:bel12-ag transposon polyprotein [Lasius niger]|uniref:Bel12-ag transposon polyprotein n=1 Tax=Lasius niger TaxID=67767 RepID=A0A0J7N1U6_LASNI|nr:bel12-ag transposon polyprotein [Lasius niger]
MHYLKTCVTGEAARLVCNLPVSGDNFAVAWTLLVSRYENQRFLVTVQLDRITNLKPLKTKSAQGLRALLTTISEAMGAIQALVCAHQSGQALISRKLTLLATSKALLRKRNGEFHPARILIDQASELSFISEELVQRAQLRRSAASIPLLGIGGTYSGRTKGIVSLHLHSIYNATSDCTIDAYVLPRLTTKIPPYNTIARSWPHTNGLQLADPDFASSGPIHIIIGSDNYGAVILPGLIRGEPPSPVAQQTIFGWVLSGTISTDNITSPAQAHHCTLDHDLQELLVRFWMQEELPESKNFKLSKDEEDCERHFLSTYSRDETGRYIVRLPLKSEPSLLGDSRSRAIHCLNRLSKKLSSNPSFRKLYQEFIQEYKNLGHIMVADTSKDRSSPVYYLPHHGVLRESTTKLRVVFNGSSRTSNGCSLNDILHAGAKFQTDISEVLLWTRTHRILFSTDIEKMFRQIAVHPEDWDLQKIFWRDKDRLTVYRLTTVTYGLNCAPFLALRALQQLVTDERHRFPKAVVPLTKGRYVDDIFGEADSILEAKETVQQLILLCKAGRFPLQKWNSNCPQILPQNRDI